MNHLLLKMQTWAGVVVAVLLAAPAWGTPVLINGGNLTATTNTISWEGIGDKNNGAPVPMSFSSTDGMLTVNGTLGTGPGTLAHAFGNGACACGFLTNDALIQFEGGNPLTLMFGSPEAEIGALMSTGSSGTFNITALGQNGVVLQSFSHSMTANVPYFLGISDSSSLLYGIRISSALRTFVGPLSVDSGAAPISDTPESTSALLIGGGLTLIGWKQRWRFDRPGPGARPTASEQPTSGA